jgi:hypothetical protein
MSPLSPQQVRHGPQLRLLRGPRGAGHAASSPREAPRANRGQVGSGRVGGRVGSQSPILVAAADPEERAAVLRNLSATLPADTQFEEASGVSEVLEQAPSSGVVMLAGELGEVSAESLMRLLGHRHPSLPVVALGASADPPAHTDTGPATLGR